MFVNVFFNVSGENTSLWNSMAKSSTRPIF